MSADWLAHSGSEDETIALGFAVGESLAPGDVVLITGQLGAGKTRLVQGIARGLGCADRPRSPTFVLVNRHRGRLVLHHCDLYRVNSLDEAADLGLAERIEDGDVLAVEWPERARGLFPEDSLEVVIERGTGEHSRAITLRPRGPNSAAVLEGARAAFAGRAVGG